MRTFKEHLNEARKLKKGRNPFKKNELFSFYKNAGYTDNLAKDTIFIDYAGYDQQKNEHVYIFVVYNVNGETYMIARLHVLLGSEGKITLEPDGMPLADDYENSSDAIADVSKYRK
jgi:hypothetical protein